MGSDRAPITVVKSYDEAVEGWRVRPKGNNSGAYVDLAVDADGHLQCDILSGSSAITQYAEGATAATITGTAILWEDAGDTLRVPSVAKPLPVSGPLTDTELRDTPVPVSGTVTASGPLTDTELRDSAVPVSGTVTAGAGSAVDAGNSTTSTLAGDAVWEGTGADLVGYSTVCCTLYADKASAASGMQFQFSTDNTNWDDSYDFNMAEDSTRRFQFPICARYFRIRYTNGGVTQNFFRVQTILHTANQLTSIHRMADALNEDRSAQVMKSTIWGEDIVSGDYKALNTYDAGGSYTGVVVIPVDPDGHSQQFDAAGHTQCDVIGALPAGSNAIGKLAANSGVDIGDVDVTSTPTPSEAGFETDFLAGTALTNTFAELINVSGDARLLTIISDCDKPYELSFDGGSTEHMRVPAGRFAMTWDLKSAELKYTGTIDARWDSVVAAAPAAGEIRATVVK